MAELKLRPSTQRQGPPLQAARRRVLKAKPCATQLIRQLNTIDRVIDRKVRLLMDQPWLERREVVEIPAKGDFGESGDNEKKNV